MSEKEDEQVNNTVLDEGIEKLARELVDREEGLSAARAELERAASDFSSTRSCLERSVQARAVLIGAPVDDRSDLDSMIQGMIRRTKRGESLWS